MQCTANIDWVILHCLLFVYNQRISWLLSNSYVSFEVFLSVSFWNNREAKIYSLWSMARVFNFADGSVQNLFVERNSYPLYAPWMRKTNVITSIWNQMLLFVVFYTKKEIAFSILHKLFTFRYCLHMHNYISLDCYLCEWCNPFHNEKRSVLYVFNSCWLPTWNFQEKFCIVPSVSYVNRKTRLFAKCRA